LSTYREFEPKFFYGDEMNIITPCWRSGGRIDYG